MSELGHMRRAYGAIEEPNDETVAAAREVLLREIGSIESPRPSRPRTAGWSSLSLLPSWSAGCSLHRRSASAVASWN